MLSRTNTTASHILSETNTTNNDEPLYISNSHESYEEIFKMDDYDNHECYKSHL